MVKTPTDTYQYLNSVTNSSKKLLFNTSTKNTPIKPLDLNHFRKGNTMPDPSLPAQSKTMNQNKRTLLVSATNKLQSLGKHSTILFESTYKRQGKDLFQEAQELEFLYSKARINFLMLSIFSILSMFSAMVEFELNYLKITNYFYRYASSSLCFIFSIFVWILIIFNYLIDSHIKAIKNNLEPSLMKWEINCLFGLFVQLIISFPHPNPIFLDKFVMIYCSRYNINTYYQINSILTSLCLLRIWHLVKLYLVFSIFNNPRTQRSTKIYNVTHDSLFTTKANMSNKPTFTYLFLYLLIVFYCSYCIRIYDSVLEDYIKDLKITFPNCMWLVIISIATVGYGDTTPFTLLGRFIGIIGAILGLFMISMMVVTVNNLIEMNRNEENVLFVLERITLNEKRDKVAGKVVTKYLKILKKMKEKKERDHLLIKKRDELNYSLVKFSEIRKDLDNMMEEKREMTLIEDKLNIIEEQNTKIMKMCRRVEEMLTKTNRSELID